MRAGAERHARIEDKVDRGRIGRDVPRGDNPQAAGDADRIELRLRQLHPVLFGHGRDRPGGNCGEFERGTGGSQQLAGVGVRLEQRDDARMLPARRRLQPRLAELRLLVRRAGIGILDGRRQRAGFQQRIAQRLGMRCVGQETDALPGHRLVLDFALFGEPLFQVMDARAAQDEACVLQQFLMQRDVGLDALDAHLR